MIIEIEGADRFIAKLTRFGDRARDLRPAWDNVHADFKRVEAMQFGSQGGRSNGWAPLSPKYAARKGNGRILVKSRHLVESLTGGADHVLRKSALELVMGTQDYKAKFHQYGTRRMPQRKVIDITPADHRRWIRYVHRHLVEVFTGRPT